MLKDGICNTTGECMAIKPLSVVFLAVLSACGTPGKGGDSAASETGDTAGVEDAVQTVTGHRAEGEITWALDFDEEAESLGYVDCAYTRSFEGQEILDQPYLCPDCEPMVKGQAVMSEGFDDCYEPIFGGSSESTETWGFATDKRKGTVSFYRSNRENSLMGELATIENYAAGTEFNVAWASDYDLTKGGIMTLSASGQGRVWSDESLQLEVESARTEPYLCGWPTGDPGTLSTDYVLAEEATFPTASLEDACGEDLSIWDLYGNWLIVDTSQPDCGPCQSMAADMTAVIETLADAGISAHYVTLLGNGLSYPYEEPSSDNWSSWLTSFDDGQPILKDRGFGYAVFQPYFADDFGYPAYAVVRPDMTVAAVEKGWGSDTPDELIEMILKE